MLRSLGGGQIKKKHKNNGSQSQSFKNNSNNHNKTQYDWFPGKSQNSKKFHNKNQEDSQLRLEVIRQKLSNQLIFVLNGHSFQNFPGIQSMISSKKTTRTTSILKIRKIHSGVWKFQVKKILKTVNFGKKWQNFGLKYPKFHHIRIFPAYKV